ncbi:hypothetical protein [Halorubrum vacuolatum]|uniref:hypothetical protein n=1 Tax=Halorubrum vacuolatum TaxID=63740 RepID=UPI0015C5DB4F|nr:hypothetical protein [Halorubrum vacuolatum]
MKEYGPYVFAQPFPIFKAEIFAPDRFYRLINSLACMPDVDFSDGLTIGLIVVSAEYIEHRSSLELPAVFGVLLLVDVIYPIVCGPP